MHVTESDKQHTGEFTPQPDKHSLVCHNRKMCRPIHSTTAWAGQCAKTLEQNLRHENNSQHQPGLNTASSCDVPICFVPELMTSSASISLT